MPDRQLRAILSPAVKALNPEKLLEAQRRVESAIAPDNTVNRDAVSPSLPWLRVDVPLAGAVAASAANARIAMPQGGVIRHIVTSARVAPTGIFRYSITAGSDTQWFSLQPGANQSMQGMTWALAAGAWLVVSVDDPAGVQDALISIHYAATGSGDSSGGGGTPSGGGAVSSVNGQVGTVILDADSIGDTSTSHKFVTAADLNKLSNLSGVNTGDQNLSGYALTSSLAGVALSGAYADLTGKPTLHTHSNQAVLDATTASFLTAEKTKLTGISAGAEVNVNADWNAVSGDAQILNKPATYAPSPHNQTASTITDFDSAADTRIAAQKAIANGLATLDASGKIPTGQIPALALTDIHVVASQAAQLALVAQEGDVAIRTDLNLTYIHNGGTSGTMADWSQILAPTGGGGSVTSVNGQTGTVSLLTTDITEGTNLYYTDARVSANADVLAATAASHAHGNKATLDAITAAFTSAMNTKLTGIETGAEVNVQSDWNAASGDALILNKPTLGTAAAQNTTAFATAAQGVKADTAVQPAGLTKAAVGLGNVDNTSDAAKPISTATQTALDGKAATGHTHDDRYYTETEVNTLVAEAKPRTFSHLAAQAVAGSAAGTYVMTSVGAAITGLTPFASYTIDATVTISFASTAALRTFKPIFRAFGSSNVDSDQITFRAEANTGPVVVARSSVVATATSGGSITVRPAFVWVSGSMTTNNGAITATLTKV